MLLLRPEHSGEIADDHDSLRLWDEGGLEVAAGRSYEDIGDVDFW